MTCILVTGGTGSRVARQLREGGHSARVATRTPSSQGDVAFDWGEPATFDGAFTGISAAYLVAPAGETDLVPAMRPAIERALTLGVRRFVLLSAAPLEKGGPMMGAVHAELERLAPEWIVLRPSWFMQNFSHGPHAATIRDSDEIVSATGDGRVGFIDAVDIARVAVQALVDDRLPSDDYILTGPEAVSYDHVADCLSRTFGRAIRHRRLSIDDLAALHERAGLPPDYAEALAGMDGLIAKGGQDFTTAEVEHIAGTSPRSIESYIEVHRDRWDRYPNRI